MTTIPLPPIPEPGEVIDLQDVSWETYEAFLFETQELHVQTTYDNGRMVIMSPMLPKHEWTKRRIGRLIEMATLEWGIPVFSLASTTWKRRDLRKGIEADECYYIQNEAKVRSRDDLDLKRDPPPDLAVEVEVTNSPIKRLPIYAGLGVNEVWHCKGLSVRFLKLGTDGQYHPVDRSEALPRIASADIERFLGMFKTMDENSIMRAFQNWLQTSK
jgi:Uma2 family endonuclease